METLQLFRKYFLPDLLYRDFSQEDEDFREAMSNSHNDEHDCFGNEATAFCRDCQACFGTRFSNHCRVCLQCIQCENCYASVGLYQQANRLFCLRNHDWEYAAFDKEVSEEEFIEIYGQVAAVLKHFPLLKKAKGTDNYRILWECVTPKDIEALLTLPAVEGFLDILQEEIKADEEREEHNRREIDELLSGLTWEALEKRYLGTPEEKDSLPLPPPEQKFLPKRDKEVSFEKQIEELQEQIKDLQEQNEDIRQMLENIRTEQTTVFRDTHRPSPNWNPWWEEDERFRPRYWLTYAREESKNHE